MLAPQKRLSQLGFFVLPENLLTRKHPLFILAVGLFSIVNAQDATLVYKNTVNSIVTIKTDNGLGSGFFVGKDIIATNYHVIEGATTAYCYTHNSTTEYKIEGYLAADKSLDLILLKVAGLNKPAIKFASAIPTQGQKVYVLGSPMGLPATISDGIVSALRYLEGHERIQITAPISPGSSGGPVLNSFGELVGISVAHLAGGQNLNFAVPKSDLELLLSFKKTYAMPFNTLYSTEKKPEEKETNYYGKDKIIDIGIFERGKPDLSLDYFANIGEQSIFFFTYSLPLTATYGTPKEQLYRAIWMEDCKLVDLETDKVYYATTTDLPKKNNPRIIYKGSKTRFSVRFDRLPPSVKRFNLIEGECTENSFCFFNVNMNDYYTATDFDYDLYEDIDEGTVAFYLTSREPRHWQGHRAAVGELVICDELFIYIEGDYIGSLFLDFGAMTYTPSCGASGTLTTRMPVGTYNYTASDGKYNWGGQITITKNGCLDWRLSKP